MILRNKQPGMWSLAGMPNPSKSAPDPPKHTRAAGFGGAVDQGHASAKVEDLARFSAKIDDPEASPPSLPSTIIWKHYGGPRDAAKRCFDDGNAALSHLLLDTESPDPWPE